MIRSTDPRTIPAGPDQCRRCAVPGPAQGAFRHLRALEDIAVANGGNRAAGTPGYDRSAEYVAERLKEAGYLVRFEEFEFPFFEDRTPPVLIAREPNGGQEAAPAGGVEGHLYRLRAEASE
jgi:hypothetical protein